MIVIERFWQGDRNARIRLDKEPWGLTKIVKKTLTHASWLAVGLLTGGALVFYFRDAPTLARELVTGAAPAIAYLFLGLFALTTYVLGGLAREQVCIYMCPWPRIQGAMTDSHTLLVSYRTGRGEPRGPARKGPDGLVDWSKRGDCIDCKACVAVCPAGIDIRDGSQLECIQCALCIDACDEIMDKIGRPRGLIAYDTVARIDAEAAGRQQSWQVVRPRTLLYAGLFAVVGAIMLAGWLSRAVVEVNVLHVQSMQTLFHWLSAMIALPAVAYAGQPFFRSARAALTAGRLNMDVPISLGVLLATGMSLFQTWRSTEQVYFDTPITLLFFLLIGRVLDQRMRLRAAGAAENLLGLRSPAASVVFADGHIDRSLITGESLPQRTSVGELVHCGTINLTGPIDIAATAVAEDTLLADIARLMATAEQARGRYVRLADRAARLYAPAVHILGAVTFAGWLLAGYGWEAALTSAIAVLIITCPCALALAVPAVHVVATSRLFRRGLVVKAPDALERLAEVDMILFDKTGTLTLGTPSLIDAAAIPPAVLAGAAALGSHSRHPYSLAVVAAARARNLTIPTADDIAEVPGSGLRGMIGEVEARLGSAAFCGVDGPAPNEQTIWFRSGAGAAVALRLHDALRADAVETLQRLERSGYAIAILSGDSRVAVAQAADALDVGDWRAEMKPADKIARIEALKREGRKVLMVGDGLNDAPALATAHASLSPATAADISQTTADAIFQGRLLAPLIEMLHVAKASQRRALENFTIAIGYNIVFVPLAMAGRVTPLIAAIAMSASSIAVTLNALRLSRRSRRTPP